MLQYCFKIMSYPRRFPQQPSKHQERARKDRGVCQAVLQSFRGASINVICSPFEVLNKCFVVVVFLTDLF